MKKTFSIVLVILAATFSLSAQRDNDPESCTSIMVGKLASTDGSVITSHTCDSWYRTWVTMTPAADYDSDTVMNIYDGRMHTEFANDETGMTVKGQIPQVKHTYKYFDTAYPCMNEKQLAMGETTITGRRELVNKNGMFMIEELQRVAMQRCTTAREAIKLMGDLVKQYGYGDSGECLTIADTKEVWHFEVFGEGPDKIGGVWAAVRIPDDQVGVSANIPRISTLNLKDKDHYMASENVFDVAKKLGYWDGKETFKFWKAYGGGKKAYSVRELFILSTLAPSLGLTDELEELPFTVKPEQKVSAAKVMEYLRSYYEGTDQDITKNLRVEVKDRKTGEVTDTILSPKANPWMRPEEIAMLNAVGHEPLVKQIRNIAVPQCAYSTVIQCRDWLPDAVGGVVWFLIDNPGQSPRIPIFCGATDVPESFKICGNHRYREDAACWRYRRTNKLAALRWGENRKVLEKYRNHFEAKAFAELPLVETRYQELVKTSGIDAASEYLNDYAADFAGATFLRWDEMYMRFWNENHFGL